MAGLREKQKARRRELIEKAAGALFVEKGFDDTTIEEIAERAVVSPATVYNYYGSKGELLLALVARGEVGIAEKVRDFMKQAQTEDPASLVTAVIMSNVEDTLSALSRELWGHVVAFIATTPDPEVAPRYLNTIADGLARAIEHVIAHFVATGVFRPDTDSRYVAYLLTRIERIQFLNFVYLKDFPLEALREAIGRDVAFILQGLRA
jgi:AcrR family transcriptional regulator